MKLKHVFKRAFRITFVPSLEWKTIESESLTVKQLLINYAFPVILFSAIGRNIGAFFAAQQVIGFGYKLAMVIFTNMLVWIALPYIVIVASTFLLNHLLPTMHIETQYLKALQIVVYTITPLLLITFFVYLHPVLRVLIPIGIFIFAIYMARVFLLGVKTLYKITQKKKIEFAVTYMLVFILLILLLQHVYTTFWDFVFPNIQAYLQ